MCGAYNTFYNGACRGRGSCVIDILRLPNATKQIYRIRLFHLSCSTFLACSFAFIYPLAYRFSHNSTQDILFFYTPFTLVRQ